MAYHGSNVAVVRRVLDRGELGAGTMKWAGVEQTERGGSRRFALTQVSSQVLPPS